ncbi:MAG: hypothetical protein CMH30_01025 [Micavibrio sp.]|nr:hypothetical protein [Micavibrio sp.]|tara:strand:- start:1635 stop:2183 length:549 start_codon:yes stop_codon:yes gene_type:complete
MVKKAVIFHGTQGSPDGNWFPWLASELLDENYDVYVPALPTPKNQNLEEWSKIVKRLPIDKDTVLIGHSCGANLLVHLLGSLNTPVKRSIIVSPFTDKIGIPDYDTLNESFFLDEKTTQMAIKNAGLIELLYGDNDPYVPSDQPKELAKWLGVKPIIIKNGGHLNVEAGYTEFPELLKVIHG